jgi:hypothetical protein
MKQIQGTDKQREWVSKEKHGATARAHYIDHGQRKCHTVGGAYARKTEEESGRHNDHYACCYVDGPVTGVLEPSAPAEGRVPREVLVVLAQLGFDNGSRGFPARQSRRRLRRRELFVALVWAHLGSAAVAARKQKAGAERARGFAWGGELASVAAVDVGKVEMLWPWSLQRRDALAAAAHRFGARGRRICRGAVWHVSVGDVGAARGRRVVKLMVLMVQAEGRSAADGSRGSNALAVRGGRSVVRSFRIQRAVAKQRRGALVALLLQALRAHGAEEAMRSQRDMRPARRRRRPALGAQAARRAEAALHAAEPEVFGARPAVLAARVRRCNRRGPRGRQARLARGARQTQHAAAARAARLVGSRHGRSVAVAVAVSTNCMTSMAGCGCGCGRMWQASDGVQKSVRRAVDGRCVGCEAGIWGVGAGFATGWQKGCEVAAVAVLQGPHVSLR